MNCYFPIFFLIPFLLFEEVLKKGHYFTCNFEFARGLVLFIPEMGVDAWSRKQSGNNFLIVVDASVMK